MTQLNTAARCRPCREKNGGPAHQMSFRFRAVYENSWQMDVDRSAWSRPAHHAAVPPLLRCWRGAMRNPAVCQDGAVCRSLGVVAADADGDDAVAVNVAQRRQVDVSPNGARARTLACICSSSRIAGRCNSTSATYGLPSIARASWIVGFAPSTDGW